MTRDCFAPFSFFPSDLFLKVKYCFFIVYKHRMTFICDQNWDAMTRTANGRYCNICKKEVIDYTDKNINTIQRNGNETENSLCGRFRLNQVDTSLIKPIEVPRQIKYFAFISSLLLTISTKTSFSQIKDTIKIEQFEPHPDKTNRAPYSDKLDNDDILEKEFESKTPFLVNNRKKYYWVRKFPFVKGVKIKHHYHHLSRRFL